MRTDPRTLKRAIALDVAKQVLLALSPVPLGIAGTQLLASLLAHDVHPIFALLFVLGGIGAVVTLGLALRARLLRRAR